MTERRRWPRREVTWTVAMSIDGGPSIAASAVDASRYGLRLAVPDTADLSRIHHGARCQIEVHLCGAAARFVRLCEVRYLGDHNVGLLFAEPLPAAIVPCSEAERRSADAVPEKPSTGHPASLMSMLRSIVLAPVHH